MISPLHLISSAPLHPFAEVECLPSPAACMFALPSLWPKQWVRKTEGRKDGTGTAYP